MKKKTVYLLRLKTPNKYTVNIYCSSYDHIFNIRFFVGLGIIEGNEEIVAPTVAYISTPYVQGSIKFSE